MPFPVEIGMFCFPVSASVPAAPHGDVSVADRRCSWLQHGIRLVTAEQAAANAIPVVTSFVLTAADKSRMYGACIVWYELLPSEVVSAYLDDDLAETDEEFAQRDLPLLHAPEAICLLSRIAIFDALMECCRQLFRMRISSDAPLPVDALAPLLHTPSPRFGAIRIQQGHRSRCLYLRRLHAV